MVTRRCSTADTTADFTLPTQLATSANGENRSAISTSGDDPDASKSILSPTSFQGKRKAEELQKEFYAGQPGPKKQKTEKVPLYVELRGGTFGSRGADKNYSLNKSQPIAKQAADYIEQVPCGANVERKVQERKPVFYKDSRDLTPRDFLNSSFLDHEETNHLIVMGSDSAAHIAVADAISNPASPSGINGVTLAMYPANSPNTDGPDNAKNAERVVTSGNAALLGHTVVVEHRAIFDATNVRKSCTSGKGAFETIEGPPLGHITEEGKIILNKNALWRPKVHFNLKGTGIKRLPAIYEFKPQQTESVELNWKGFEAKLNIETESESEDKPSGKPGYKKIIIVKSPGDGIIPEEYVPKLAALAEKEDVIVIRSAGLPKGETSSGMDDEELRFVNAKDLRSPQLEVYVKYFAAWLRAQEKTLDADVMRKFINSVQFEKRTVR